jgi:hypothetical protein
MIDRLFQVELSRGKRPDRRALVPANDANRNCRGDRRRWRWTSTSPRATAISTYSRYVIPGAYELIYAVNQSASGTPSNRRADLRCFNVP